MSVILLIIRFLLPLAYTLAIGTAFSLVFKKKFADSLAPAFFVHVLFILLMAMLVESVNVGIVLGIVVAVFVIVVFWIRHKDCFLDHINAVFSINGKQEMLIVFLTMYTMVYVINYGNHFFKYDEFSHWGIFIKETLRLDKLFCASNAVMAHKDYVPATTLFEVLWCRLSLRFSEADSYRGIQMLQLSMLFPLVFHNNDKKTKLRTKVITIRFLIVVLAPLLVSSSLTLWFYHTIYKDVIFGIMFYYCMWIAISEEDTYYSAFLETISLAVMILTKMTALAVVPMIVIFYFIYHTRFVEGIKCWVSSVVMTILPVLAWFSFNKYVDKYVPNTGSNQSYDSVGKQFMDVIKHNGAIPYQSDVENYFFKSLFEWKLIGNIPFVTSVFIIIGSFLVIAYKQKSRRNKQKVLLITLWVLLASIAYSILTLYLYCTAFGDYEARMLASYERYMSTFLFTILFLVIAALFIYIDQESISHLIVLIVLIFCVTVFINFEQLLPGKLTGDRLIYPNEVEAILDKVNEEESICIFVSEEERDKANLYLTYYCSPRYIECVSESESLENSIISSDYFMLHDSDEHIIKFCENIFDVNEIKINYVYKIENCDGDYYLRE